MAFKDPLAAYNAADNLEALFVRDALIAADVDAFVVEDISQVGVWLGGLINEIHKPQVWIERANAERAKPVLEAFERRKAELQTSAQLTGDGAVIEVICEDCGGKATFPPNLRGTVQDCPNCGAFVDVGDADVAEDWQNDREPPGD